MVNYALMYGNITLPYYKYLLNSFASIEACLKDEFKLEFLVSVHSPFDSGRFAGQSSSLFTFKQTCKCSCSIAALCLEIRQF